MGANSPELSLRAGQLLSQAPSNDVEGAQAQPHSHSVNEEIEQFETGGVAIKRILYCKDLLLH